MSYLARRWNGEGGYREVLAVATPLILSTAAWAVQHFVDRMFLSWYSPETVAASMPAGILYFSIVSLFMGTAGYVNTFVAQYHGAGRNHRIGPVLWQGIHVSILGGLAVAALIPLSTPIFELVGHEPNVQQHEVEYFRILCLGGFPVIASSAISGFFAGRGKTWPVMWVNTLFTAVNLVLDFGLIFGHWGLPELGMQGAGIATVLASIVSFFVYMAIISMRSNNEIYHTLKGWRPEKELFWRLLRFGFPSGVQFFLEMAGFTAFILLVGRLGTKSLAATNIAFNINTLAFMPMIGFGVAVSVLVGRYVGSDRIELAERSVYSGFQMTLLYMTTIAAGYVLAPDIFVAPFAAQADSEHFSEIYTLTVILLRFVAIYCVFDTMNIIFASAIKGAGDTRFVMFMVVIASICGLAIPTYLAIVVFGYGLTVSWVIVTAYVIILGFVFFGRFLSGRWKCMRVIEDPKRFPSRRSECPDIKFGA